MPPINPRFGVLNKIEKPTIGNRINLQTDNAAGLLSKIIEDAYTPDSLSNTGPYKAIVLRVEPDKRGRTEAGSWSSQFFGNFFGGKQGEPLLLEIKARIPEIHAMLPIPLNDEESIIDMYPTFIAQNDTLPIPEVNSLVWVDFGNKQNFSDPIYLGPVVQTKTTVESKGKKSAKNAHDKACAGSFLSSTPSGDPISFINKPLSHSGISLLNRGKEISKENKILRGNRTSAATLSKWEKAITSNNGTPSLTWIGNLPSNGLEDEQHEAEKRDTIICSPNTTDFSSPVELIYFLHSIGEFGDNHDFIDRFSISIRKMSTEGRNFVLVIPELAWSILVKDYKERGRKGLGFFGRDSFSSLHSEVLDTLKTSFSNKINISFITIVAFGAGGNVLKEMVKKKDLNFIKPNKIILAEAIYGDSLQILWDQYIYSYQQTELNILVKKNSISQRKVKEFLDAIPIEERTKTYYEEISNKNDRQIGDMAIGFINPVSKKVLEEASDKDVEDVEKNPPADFDGQEGPAAQGKIKDSISQDLPRHPDSKMPPSPNPAISPSAQNKSIVDKKTSAIVKESKPFMEARVRVEDYAPLQGNEAILTGVPSVPDKQCFLHKLAVKRFLAMNQAWLDDNPGSSPIKVVSGWRKHRWTSRGEYEEFLKANNKTSKEIGFNSPHEVGLAFDIGNNGLYPAMKTNVQQKQTTLYKWLVSNAHKFGITPYAHEAWHWEVRIPRESWASGEDFTDNLAVRIEDVGGGGDLPSSSPPLGTNCIGYLGNALRGEKDMTNNSSVPSAKTVGELGSDEKKKLIVELANELRIEPEIALAFFAVEAGCKKFPCSGFCKESGRPLIKFEPHVFANTDRLIKFGISPDRVPWYDRSSKMCIEKWKQMGAKEGWSYSSKCDENYRALEYAIGINEELAYQSISTGLPQIMGFNHKMMGYKSAKEMFEAFSKSEEAQMRGFFTFVSKTRGLADALRNKDFLTAAGKYNGHGKEQLYASKLDKNYNEFKERGILA